jgi:hypothetical protein
MRTDASRFLAFLTRWLKLPLFFFYGNWQRTVSSEY